MQDALLELQFGEAASRACTAADVELGYQIFLGRDPENTVVVEDAMTNQLRDFIPGLLTSEEFHNEVLTALGNARAVPHESESRAPSARQKDWLFSHLLLPPRSETLLRGSYDWPEWLSILVALPGFPIIPSTDRASFKPIEKKRSKSKRTG